MSYINDKFLKLIEDKNERDFVPFFQKLNAEEKKALIPIIKKEGKRLETYQDMGNGKGWGYIGSDKQRNMVKISKFLCFENADAKSVKYWDLPNEEEMNRLLQWHCPEWFNTYINGLTREDYIGLTYPMLIDWMKAGYIQPIPELIVKVITGSIDYLEKHLVTLDEHIWYLFEYPSSIHWADKWVNKKDIPQIGERQWVYAFKKYSASGRIDRMRVLRESLAAVNRNFEKMLTGWFADLVVLMEPSDEELIQLQPELFSALSCPFSKPVNTVLSLLKKIHSDHRFHTAEFIAFADVLLSSDVKAVLTNTLSILEKIAKKEKNKRDDICIRLVNIFLNKDEALQTKAAKLITQYASQDANTLKAALSPYSDSILMSVKSLLQPWLETADNSMPIELETTIATDKMPLIREDNRIPDIPSLEDFIFLSGQAFTNSEPYLFDQFVAALMRFAPQIDKHNVTQLEPAFLQAHKVLANWNATIGFFDRILAAFFIAYGDFLIQQFPNETKALQQLKKKYDNNTFNTNNWKSSKMWNYIPFMDFLTLVRNDIISGQTLPLLSTPTHTPGWIDPLVLVNRLIQYQTAGKEPRSLDMELALQRCALDNTAAALQLAKQSLNEEYKALFIYLLSGKMEKTTNSSKQHYWISALLTRHDKESYLSLKKKTGWLEKWLSKTIPEEHFSGAFDWAVRKETKKEHVFNGKKYEWQEVEYKILKINLPEYSFDMTKGFFYEYSFMKFGNASTDWGADKVRFITFSPNNHDALLVKVIQSLFVPYGAPDVKTMTAILSVIHQLNTSLSEMEHLFFACCLLHSDKTVRMYTADIWSQKVMDKTIDSEKLGQHIGRLEADSLFPLKRFTDLIFSNMLGIDQLHNQELLKMIEAINLALEDKNVPNAKKLNEVSKELKMLL